MKLAAEHLSDGKVVGAIRLGVTDAANRTAELGYSFARSYWRQGLGVEAAGALCWTRVSAPWACIEFTPIATPETPRLRGEWRDTVLYAILAEEWISPG